MVDRNTHIVEISYDHWKRMKWVAKQEKVLGVGSGRIRREVDSAAAGRGRAELRIGCRYCDLGKGCPVVCVGVETDSV